MVSRGLEVKGEPEGSVSSVILDISHRLLDSSKWEINRESEVWRSEIYCRGVSLWLDDVTENQ